MLNKWLVGALFAVSGGCAHRAAPTSSGIVTVEGAMQQMIMGDDEAARRQLESLLDSSNEQTAQSAGALLAQLLQLQSDWTQLERLASDGSGVDFAGVMGTVPKERFSVPKAASSVPLRLSASGTPMVLTQVNGNESWWWIDSGAGMSVVASDVADRAGVLPVLDSSLTIPTSTSQDVSTSIAVVGDLAVGPVRVKNHPVLILDEQALTFDVDGQEMKIDGILGWPWIQQLRLELDLGSETMTLGPPAALVAQPSLFWIGFPMVPVEVAGQQLTLGLDTGAQATGLFAPFLSQFPDDSRETILHRSGGAGGYETVEAAVVRDVDLSLGGSSVHFEALHAFEQSPGGVTGLSGMIGIDVATRLVIDFQARQFEID
jgi:predicted aspartyl protease